MNQEEYDALEESVRSLTALFSPDDDEYDDEDDEEEDQLANDFSDHPELPPIATLSSEPPLAPTAKPLNSVSLEVTDDLFAIPLRARKGKDRVSASAKRKR